MITSAYLSLASWRWSTKTYSSGRGDQKVTGAPGLALETAHCFGPLLPGTSNPKASLWAIRGVEFSAKLRTWARKIEELEADIKELKAIPERIQALKSSIRQLEKDIVTADKANAAAGGWPKGKAPRIGYIADAHAFEKYMAEWMRWLGWDDAKAMPVGPDEGIDVKATGALGQAKHWDTPLFG